MLTKLKSLFRKTAAYHQYKILRARYASARYGSPSKDMFVIGITGTNGKTTTSFMIHHIFNRLIDKAMLLGTNAIKYGEETHINTTKMTSPDALDIQKTLAQAKAK